MLCIGEKYVALIGEKYGGRINIERKIFTTIKSQLYMPAVLKYEAECSSLEADIGSSPCPGRIHHE